MNEEDTAAQRATARDWDSKELLYARLDDLLNQFLEQTADAETRSPRAELTHRIEQICGPAPVAGDNADNVVPRRLGVYDIVRPLGSGGMGEVYLARHTVLNRNVALKLLRWERAAMPNSVERFQREMQALAAMSHPHVVSAYDGNVENDMVYLVMELVDGIDLEQLHKNQPDLRISVCCEVIRQAALGLAAIHDAGIVHRDVKPSNIMLTRNGTVKLLDLGLARLVDQGSDLTGSRCVVGTERFMSPEQLLGLPDIDHRTDIYSLGRTLERMLCWNVSDRADRQVADRRKTEVRLAGLILEMVAEDRETRVSTAALVAERLAEFCGGIDRQDLVAAAFGNSNLENPDTTPDSTAVVPDSSQTRSISLVQWIAWIGFAFVAFIAAIWLWKERFSSQSDVSVSRSTEASSESVTDLPGTNLAESASTPVLHADQASEPAVVEYGLEREFAQWVLKQGGSVTVNTLTSGRWAGKRIGSAEALPEGPFLIQVIELFNVILTDQDRALLRRLHDLEGLHLYDLGTSDSDIESLNPNWKMKWLYIPGHDVSDRSVAALDAYQNSLLVLDLSHSQISDESIRRFRMFPLLRGLMLANTRISDEAVSHLIEFPSLVLLDISGTQVTAAGLHRLQEFSQLTKLKLRDLPVDDNILAELSKLPLVELDLRDTPVTTDGVQRYRRSHPDCDVRHN